MFSTFPLMIWRLGGIALIIVALAIARGIYLRRPSDGGATSSAMRILQIIALLSFLAYILVVNRDRFEL